MKRSIFFALALLLLSMTASAALAQTAKIGWINTAMFDDDKDGIKKYVAAANAIDLEFKPRYTDLQTIAGKINALPTPEDVPFEVNMNLIIEFYR